MNKTAQVIKRFFLALFLFTIFYLLLTIRPAFAQAAPNTNPDVPQNLHTYTQNAMIEVMAATICQITGVDPINPNQKCLGVDVKSGKIGFIENGGGAIGAMGSLIAVLYNPPLHAGDYFQYLAQNFGLAKPAYAAYTTGFEGLKPLMGLWSAFRNIVYLFFVVVFVVIGLAVMLRIKIDPRTVMSIENQIPKIIIGLILVTFSFAIAGFLIDLMYIVIYLVFNLITSSVAVNFGDLTPMNIQGKNAIEVGAAMAAPTGLFGIANTMAFAVKDMMSGLLNINTNTLRVFDPFGFFSLIGIGGTAGVISPFDLLIDIVSALAGTGMFFRIMAIETIKTGIPGAELISNLLQSGAKAGVAAGTAYATYAGIETLLRFLIPYLIIFLILIFAMLFALFRLWFQLLLAYIMILIDVVFAPFWILAGLFPGSPVSFGAWLRDIIANLSAFPVTILMFLLGKVFIEEFKKMATAQGNTFVPPLIGNPASTEVIGALIGLGVILLTPQVVAMMKEALKAPQFKQMAAIGQALGVGPAAAGGLVTAVGSPYGALAMYKNIFGGEGKRGTLQDAVAGLKGMLQKPGVGPGKKTGSAD